MSFIWHARIFGFIGYYFWRMSMFKHNGKLLFNFIMVMTLFAGCGGSGNPGNSPDDTTGMKNFPSSISVSIPKTLGTTQNQPSESLGNIFASVMEKDAAPAPQSMSYGNVNTIVASLKNQMASMTTTLVCMDRTISGLTPSDATVSGRKVTMTQAMVDTILSLVPEDLRDRYKAAYEKEGIVGKEESIDPFIYQSISENGYNFKYSSTGDSGSMTIYWSSDKTQIKIVMKSASYTYGFITNLAAKSSRMYVVCNMSAADSPTGEASKYSSVVSMKEISGSEKSGVYLSTSYTDEKTSGTVKSFNFEGVADNDGGYIINNYLYLSYVVPQQSYYIEGFDSTGSLTYQKNGAFVAYGAEPAAYKTMYDAGKTSIDSLQGSVNNDSEITGSNPAIVSKDVTGTVEGECYIIYDSNATAVVNAVTGFNDDPSNNMPYCDTLNAHVIGLGVCDKAGSLSLYISNPSLYSLASSFFTSKYSFTDSKMGSLTALAK